MPLTKLFRRFLRRFNYYLKFLSFLGFLFFFFIQSYQFFSIKKIKIQGKVGDEILGLKEVYGRNILLFNSKNFEKKLETMNSYIKKVKVYKKFPDTLKIKVVFRKPLGYLKVRNGYYILDKDGRVLERIRDIRLELPIILFYQKFNFDDFYPGAYLKYIELIYSLKLLETFKNLGVKINRVDILRENMIRFNLKDNNMEVNEIIASAEKDLNKQIWELEEIFKYFKISGEKIKEIDLRFKRPILKK